jgi:hypothetical protein
MTPIFIDRMIHRAEGDRTFRSRKSVAGTGGAYDKGGWVRHMIAHSASECAMIERSR